MDLCPESRPRTKIRASNTPDDGPYWIPEFTLVITLALESMRSVIYLLICGRHPRSRRGESGRVVSLRGAWPLDKTERNGIAKKSKDVEASFMPSVLAAL